MNCIRQILGINLFCLKLFNEIKNLIKCVKCLLNESKCSLRFSFSLSLSLSGTFSLRQAPAPLLCSARPRQATPWPRGRSTRPLHGPCPATHSPAAPSSSRSPLSTAHGGARPSVPWLSPYCSPYCSVTALVGETLMLCSMIGSNRLVQQLTS